MPPTRKARKSAATPIDQCPCAGKNLDKFIQPAMLAVLAAGPVHGYSIVQRIGQMPMFRGSKPDATGVYRYLKALEDREMVTSSWDLSETGPAKRLFCLTTGGVKCLQRWGQTLKEYRDQLSQMIDAIDEVGSKPELPKRCCCRKK